MKVTYIDHAYAAGFIDGEGCLTFTSSITVKCNHTYRPTLEWLMAVYGGTLREHNDTSHKKQAWTWSIHADTAQRCLKSLLPFLKEKQDKAKLLIDYQDTIGSRGLKVPREILQLREDIKQKVKSL